MFEIQKYHSEAFSIFDEYKNEVMLDYLIKDLNSGIKEGYFRPEIPVDLIAKIRMAEIQMLFNPDFYESNKKSVYDMHLEFMDYFLRGIMTPKGLSVYNEYLNVKIK